MRFYLDSDLNLALGRRLQAHGHEVIEPSEAGLERTADRDVLAYAAAAGLVILTHNERRFAEAGGVEQATILFVPQPSQEDVPRVAEAIQRRVGAGFSPGERVLRFGLHSGWSPVGPEELSVQRD